MVSLVPPDAFGLTSSIFGTSSCLELGFSKTFFPSPFGDLFENLLGLMLNDQSLLSAQFLEKH